MTNPETATQLPAHWPEELRAAFWTAVNAPTYDESAAATLALTQGLAALIRSHPGAIPYRPQLDEDGGFWWDTRDRDAAADLIDPTRTAAAAVSVPPPAPQADDQATLRDRIRRAVCEAEGFGWDTDMLEPDEYGEVADAVLAVLPKPADRAAVLREAADEAETVAESLRKHHEFERSTGALDVMTELRRLAAVSGPVAGEQQNETPEAAPESCAHCGKNIRLITGTLAEWWVHDPGGHTICVPGQAVSSPRATPKAAAEVQDGAAS